MSLLLSTPTMLFLSGAWIDPQRERPLFEKWPRGRLLLPHIEAAHRELAASDEPDTEAQARVKSLTDGCSRADDEHDRKARAVWYGLTAASEGVDDRSLGAKLLAERDRLMPAGLDVTRWSWADEVGESERVVGRRTCGGDALLRGISLARGFTLLNAVEQWVAAAQRLGALERERASVAPAAAGPSQHALRSAWVKVARQLESDATYDELPEETQERLLGRLRKAVQQARAKADKAAEEKPSKPAEVKEEAKPTDVKPTDVKPTDVKQEVQPPEVKAVVKKEEAKEEVAKTG